MAKLKLFEAEDTALRSRQIGEASGGMLKKVQGPGGITGKAIGGKLNMPDQRYDRRTERPVKSGAVPELPPTPHSLKLPEAERPRSALLALQLHRGRDDRKGDREMVDMLQTRRERKLEAAGRMAPKTYTRPISKR